jgi:ubiquinone/menaquinone biosynthesis C-methylase UbiE
LDKLNKPTKASVISHQKPLLITLENLEFWLSTAEHINLPDHSVDMIISAQAVHWFHGEPFYKEAKRLLREKGVLAVWCFNTLFEDPEIQKIFEVNIVTLKC